MAALFSPCAFFFCLRQQLVRKLFEDFDGDHDGLVSHKEFKEGYRYIHTDHNMG